MDDDHRREKRVFVLIFCVYVAIAIAWGFGNPHRTSSRNREMAAVTFETTVAPEVFSLNDFLKMPKQTHPPLVAGREKNAVREQKFHPIIEEAANRYEVDSAMIKAIIWAESSFNPEAISEKGALGLMQLMPSTARSLGITDCFNPEENIHAGVKYFKQLMTRFDDDPRLALAAYNAGSGRVIEYQGIPPFKATRYFIDQVFAYYREIKEEFPGPMDTL